MTAHLAQWLSLALRWAHVIVGVSWIGTSFYFNWLNARIAPPATPEPGVSGELWSVHGGGFYRVLKYGVAPDRLPATLHWFKWEAYATWWTGLSLLVLLYYVGAREYLLDSAVSTLTPAAGIATGVATLAAAWLVYDALCRSPLGARPAAFAVLGLLLVTALAWGLSHLLSARAAYLHVGAALGTIMAANVFRVIIPSQRAMVASLLAGQAPDARRGSQAALRSLHNNYLTLPVVLTMISSHYPMLFQQPYAWQFAAAIIVGAGLVRHYYNLKDAGRSGNWIDWLLVYAAGVAVSLVIV
ncbi:MAG TPA: urate hydroxylase PuuD, partial [Gemmatimonadales bacterium]|nr:urate hydroxylase PuuD [Gemmatimonadales bacterium]